MRLDCSR